MNQMKITFAGEVTRRFRESTKTGKEMAYIVVKIPRGEFCDIMRLKVKDTEMVKPYAIGAKVLVEAFVGGREWTNPTTNKISYFTDLNLYSIKADAPQVAPKEAPAAEDDLEDIPF